jgi:AcrR family transcriptional regulator
MGAHAKTSEHDICRAVRQLLESGGESALSMQAIAEAVGIRAPSIYKRFANRGDLLTAAAGDALRELADLLRRSSGDPTSIVGTYESLERMAHVYRKFAKRNPRTYELIFSAALASSEDLLAARQAAAEPLLALLRQQVGAEKALPAARLLVSYLHGFLSIELAQAFRFGGNVSEAFEYGLTTIIDRLANEKSRQGGERHDVLGESFSGNKKLPDNTH